MTANNGTNVDYAFSESLAMLRGHKIAFVEGGELDFHGVKVALFDRKQLIVLLRDDIDSIPWPNHWDFPGGGKEANETPIECMQREVYEELNIELPASAIVWERRYSRHKEPDAVFMVAQLPVELRDALRLGEEGQAFTRMSIDEYSQHPKAIPSLVHRLSDYLHTLKGEEYPEVKKGE